MSSSNDTSKKDSKKEETKNDGKKDNNKDDHLQPPDTDEAKDGYITPNVEEPQGDIYQCEKCKCWTDGREHKCEPENKGKYA